MILLEKYMYPDENYISLSPVKLGDIIPMDETLAKVCTSKIKALILWTNMK